MSLTRRAFLERLALAGGASLAYEAMTGLGLLATPAQAPFGLTGQVSGVRVVVLGAGLAGMTVAYELGKVGFDCRVLQARPRPGGRVHTVRRGTGLGLLATPAQAPFSLSGQVSGVRVVILGAGLAGMTVAYELGKVGFDCRVLEARARPGGRVFTVRRGTVSEEDGPGQTAAFDEGLYFNAGPMRISHHHHTTLAYCRELQVRDRSVRARLRERVPGADARPARRTPDPPSRGPCRFRRLHRRVVEQVAVAGATRSAADRRGSRPRAGVSSRPGRARRQGPVPRLVAARPATPAV